MAKTLNERKLALVRKASTQSSTRYSISGQKKRQTHGSKKVTLPTWCPFCKKSHVGGDTCMGHYP